MLNPLSFEAVQQATFAEVFCRPLYENYCFARLPATFKRLLTGKKGGLPDDTLISSNEPYESLVILLIDGFGWRFLKKYLDELPFLRRFMEQGIVSQITSQFPSTTVAHLTCLNTGLPVGQSGLYEWYYYEPLINAILVPFRYTLAGEANSLSLQDRGVIPETLFPFSTFYQELKEEGIPSTLYYHRSYAHSPYSQLTGRGATIIPYASCAEAIYKLSEQLHRQPKGYIYLYLGDVDTTAHEFGPDAPETDRAIRDCFHLLEQRLGHHPFFKNPKTAFVLTADHGQTLTPPSRTVAVNHLCPELIPWMRQDFRGHPLAPAGAPRDYFLYIKDNHLEEAYDLLQTRFRGKALVHYTQTLIEKGLFGPLPLAPRFLERIGNIVILPLEGESVFWYEKDRFEQCFYGNHGGLSREEMETIFLFQAGG
jgi:predicted AlkP superfamily pyrophosphatase or phosphodiesterase